MRCNLRQVVCLSDADCNAICLILRIKKKEISTPFGFYGKTEQWLPTFNVNNYENFQLFFLLCQMVLFTHDFNAAHFALLV